MKNTVNLQKKKLSHCFFIGLFICMTIQATSKDIIMSEQPKALNKDEVQLLQQDIDILKELMLQQVYQLEEINKKQESKKRSSLLPLVLLLLLFGGVCTAGWKKFSTFINLRLLFQQRGFEQLCQETFHHFDDDNQRRISQQQQDIAMLIDQRLLTDQANYRTLIDALDHQVTQVVENQQATQIEVNNLNNQIRQNINLALTRLNSVEHDFAAMSDSIQIMRNQIQDQSNRLIIQGNRINHQITHRNVSPLDALKNMLVFPRPNFLGMVMDNFYPNDNDKKDISNIPNESKDKRPQPNKKNMVEDKK